MLSITILVSFCSRGFRLFIDLSQQAQSSILCSTFIPIFWLLKVSQQVSRLLLYHMIDQTFRPDFVVA